MGEIQQRVDLAKDANRALDYYEAITSQAVIADNYPDDMNSRIGVVCRSFFMGKKDYSDSGYDVCTEYNPKGIDYPIRKAQIRLRENQRELLLLSQESSGKLSLSMVDPYSANIISICQEADQALVVTSKKSNEVA
jgi:hypothetical protein